MIVVVEAVLAQICHIQIGPAIVVVIANGNADAPAIVGHARLRRDVRKCAVVIVMKERCVRRLGFSVHGVIGHAIDEIDIEPSIVVVVEQCYSTAEGLHDILFGARAALIAPARQTSLSGIVLEDNGATGDKSPGGDGAMLGVMHGSVDAAGARATLGRLGLLRFCAAAKQPCDRYHTQRKCPAKKREFLGLIAAPHGVSALCS